LGKEKDSRQETEVASQEQHGEELHDGDWEGKKD
jgi:hypothetical protein